MAGIIYLIKVLTEVSRLAYRKYICIESGSIIRKVLLSILRCEQGRFWLIYRFDHRMRKDAATIN